MKVKVRCNELCVLRNKVSNPSRKTTARPATLIGRLTYIASGKEEKEPRRIREEMMKEGSGSGSRFGATIFEGNLSAAI